MDKPVKNEEHVITDREKRAWQAGKKRAHREKPNLTISQRIEFLELVARMASASEFERRLGLSAGDIQHYKKMLDVESQDEARVLARKMKQDNAEKREASIIEQTKKVREAEAVAQERLDEIEAKRNVERPVKEVDTTAIKREDADRQRRFAAQQAETDVPAKEWKLPVEGNAAQRQELVDRFRRELVYHGFSFVRKKYGATNTQIKFEAHRLGLKLNWDIVRR